MESLYKIEGYVAYEETSVLVEIRKGVLLQRGIPVKFYAVNEGGMLVPALTFSFYNRANENFEAVFLELLQSGVNLCNGEIAITNFYTGEKRTFVVNEASCFVLIVKKGEKMAAILVVTGEIEKVLKRKGGE